MSEQDTAKSLFLTFPRAELQKITARSFFSARQKNFQIASPIGNPSGNLTYDDLNRAANSVAQAVSAFRGNEAKPVALLFHSDTAMIIAPSRSSQSRTVWCSTRPVTSRCQK